MSADAIDTLLGVAAGSPLDLVRRGRETARANMQGSYAALFAPAEWGGVSREERLALAAFVAGLHQERAVAAFYAGQAPMPPGLAGEAARGAVHGPYGRFPPGPLSREGAPGPEFVVAAGPGIGDRLAAALAHAHMLVFHPRDADAAWLQRLLDAGWTTTDIVTLSQLVSFLSFQIRVVIGLRALQSSMIGAAA